MLVALSAWMWVVGGGALTVGLLAALVFWAVNETPVALPPSSTPATPPAASGDLGTAPPRDPVPPA